MVPLTVMDERYQLAVPVSRRGLRLGDLDRDGRPVVQICPRCRRDWHRPRSRCRHARCGAALPPPLVLELVVDTWAPSPVEAPGEPAGEPDPEEAHETELGIAMFRWVWLYGRLEQLRRDEARMGAQLRRTEAQLGRVVMELLREAGP